MTTIRPPGQPATRSQQHLLLPLIPKRSIGELVVIHHITEDSARRLQMEIERRCSVNGLAFERFILDSAPESMSAISDDEIYATYQHELGAGCRSNYAVIAATVRSALKLNLSQ